jgi:hypothetical protein
LQNFGNLKSFYLTKFLALFFTFFYPSKGSIFDLQKCVIWDPNLNQKSKKRRPKNIRKEVLDIKIPNGVIKMISFFCKYGND